MQKKDLLLFGIQGSGKGTQCRMILDHYGQDYTYFEPGNICRALTSTDNALGNYIGSVISQGKLIDESVLVSLFDAYYATITPGQSMLIDGFPRNFPQMYMFLDRILRSKRDWCAIFIELSEEKAFERMTLRGRSDDTPEAIKKRIHIYQEETSKIVDEFERLGRVKRVNGDDTVENVFAQIRSVIDSLN